MPAVDRAGRPQRDPHRLLHGVEGALWLAARAPAGYLRVVPPEFWSLDMVGYEEPCAIVACPCGETPAVEVLDAVAAGECDCGRHFFFDGGNVWAFRAVEDAPTPVGS